MLPRSLSPFRRINIFPIIFICIVTYVTHRLFSSRDPRVTVLSRFNYQLTPTTDSDLHRRDSGPQIYMRNDGPQIDMRNDGPQIDERNDGPQIDVRNDGPKIDVRTDGPLIDERNGGSKIDVRNDGPQSHVRDEGPQFQKRGKIQRFNVKNVSQQIQEKKDGQQIQEKKDGQQIQEKKDGQQIQEKKNGQHIQKKDDGQHIQEKDDGQQIQEKKNGQHIQKKDDGQHIQERKPDEKIDVVDNFEMAARRDRVLQYCNGSAKILPQFARWIRSSKHKFFHCPVEKTASTFWRRFTYQLEFTYPMRSPFDISATYIYSVAKDTIAVKEKKEELKKLWNQSIKQLYVRDPYSRLFSAYVDKVLAPNPIYWKKWGQPSISKYRNTTSSRKCADDVTFSEFTSYALSDPGQADPHLKAIYNLCTPCAVNYTIIGKMETFRRDTLQLLAPLNITEKQMELDRMPGDVSSDAVTDSITDSLSPSWLNSTLRCITKDNVIRRIWRKLQIRGFISWRKPYDLDPARAQHMDSTKLIAHMEKVMSTSTNHTELKLQKRQAMLEAFASLKSSHFEKIKKVYKNDFLMFGYEPKMKALLSAKPIKITGALDWWKDWDMTSVLV